MNYCLPGEIAISSRYGKFSARRILLPRQGFHRTPGEPETLNTNPALMKAWIAALITLLGIGLLIWAIATSSMLLWILGHVLGVFWILRKI
jgi:type IV secretory pathway TrbD component